jgi:hypothetical protein
MRAAISNAKPSGMGRQRGPDAPDRAQQIETGSRARRTETCRREGPIHDLGGVHVRESELSLGQRRDRVQERWIVGDGERASLRDVDHAGEADRLVAEHDDMVNDHVTDGRSTAAEDVHRHAR